jgi:pimeloyl-ACP methyl ester carboxylesterase
VSDRAVVFGGGLSGIVTEPDGPAARTGVLILSAGILHRVGPNRLHVRLARALAQAGFPVLRFDFSGIGESGVTSGGSYEERINREASAAMDVLAALGAERFLLFGLCSGADNAFRIALADSRVKGAILVQIFSFTSPRYALEHYARRFVQPTTWVRVLRGRIALADTGAGLLRTLRRSAPRGDPDDPARFWQMPPATAIVADVRTLLRRGVELLFIYSRPSPADHNFRAILKREMATPEAMARVEVEVFTGSDHTFTPLAHQARLVERVVAWASRREARGPSDALAGATGAAREQAS